MSSAALAEYFELVREYHLTLDLISPQAMASWDSLLAGALLYEEVITELAPGCDVLLDVGSGVGLPGIPLAIVAPERTVHLVERRRRRAAFLNLAKGRLRLHNVHVHHQDVTDLSGLEVKVVTAQAVGRFSVIHGLTSHLHAAEVALVSSKGPDWADEAAELMERQAVQVIGTASRDRAGGSGVVAGLLVRRGA